MLLVVFGAGASYDSVPWFPPSNLHQWRPPLANNLFDPAFVDPIVRFPQMHPILPLLRPPADQPGTVVNVERVLDGLLAESESYRDRTAQIAAVRYYLHCLFWVCNNNWQQFTSQGTNYLTLLDLLEQYRRAGETIGLVSFNYDTLLDEAVASRVGAFEDVVHYTANDRFPLFKLHGSRDWARVVINARIPDLGQLGAWQIVDRMIANSDELDLTDNFLRVTQWPAATENADVVFPAIAIPLTTKDSFECPPIHVTQLQAFLGQVDKILVIGWRATDAPFLELLAQHLPGAVQAAAVANSAAGASQILANLAAARVRLAEQATTFDGGFSAIISRRLLVPFLGQ